MSASLARAVWSTAAPGLASSGAPRIAILGAGISGLVAAYELRQLGLPVTVFERGGRVGGRIETFRFPGTDHLGELGAMRIPGSHANTLRYISRMGLDGRLARFTTLFKGRGGVVDLEGLSPPPPAVGGSVDALTDLVARSALYKLQVVVAAMSPGELRDVFQQSLAVGLYPDMLELVRTQVEPRRLWQLLNASVEQIVGLLGGLLAGLEARMAPSLRLFLRDIAWEVSEDLYLLKGGLRQLPERLAAHVADALHLRCEVVRMHSHEDFVELVLREGEGCATRRECFDYVLCTLPLPALREVELEGFGPGRLQALGQVRYASASKVLLLCRRRFWRQPPQRLTSGASFVGGLSRQVYYSEVEAAPREGGGGVLLASYALGADSERMAELPDDELVARVRGQLRHIHPELDEPGMVRDFKVRHWQKEPGFLGGCSVTWPIYHPSAAGEAEVTRLWQEVARPDKRVYFAGEHCSHERAWVEGAVESSLRAVGALLERLSEAPARARGLR